MSHAWPQRWRGTRYYWLAQVSGWGALLVLLAWSISVSKSDKKITEFVFGLIWAGTGLFLTHLWRVVLIYYRGRSPNLFVLILSLGLWLTAVALAIASATILLVYSIASVVGPSFDIYATNDPMDFSDFVIIDLIALIPWLILYFGINYYRSFQQSRLDGLQLHAAVKEAELRSLRAQVDPHFLFNSLNTLRALIPDALSTPREAVTLLSEVLRTSLNSSARAAVPLAEELEHIDNYLALEALRFEQRLRVRRLIAPSARACIVPTLLVQTLVENAVKYGIATREAGGEIVLCAEIRAQTLCVTVTNPGRIAWSNTSTGLGLQNARARLALIFGAKAALSLLQVEPDLVCAELRVPLLSQEPPGPDRVKVPPAGGRG